MGSLDDRIQEREVKILRATARLLEGFNEFVVDDPQKRFDFFSEYVRHIAEAIGARNGAVSEIRLPMEPGGDLGNDEGLFINRKRWLANIRALEKRGILGQEGTPTYYFRSSGRYDASGSSENSAPAPTIEPQSSMRNRW